MQKNDNLKDLILFRKEKLNKILILLDEIHFISFTDYKTECYI